MFTCARLLHLSRSKLPMNCSKLRMSVFAPSSALVRKGKEFPNGISLEVLNLETHDLTSLRKLLVQAFVFNQEPIIHTLCERAYPGVPMREKLPQIERQFEKFFTDQFLARKIEQGMSVIAIEKGDGQRYVSSAFVERYSGAIYTSELRLLRDPFWQYGFRFMGAYMRKRGPCCRNTNQRISRLCHTEQPARDSQHQGSWRPSWTAFCRGSLEKASTPSTVS